MVIRLTENKLRSLIENRVRKALNELSIGKYNDSSRKSILRGQVDRGVKFDEQAKNRISDLLNSVGCTVKFIELMNNYIKIICSKDDNDISFIYIKKVSNVYVNHPVDFANFLTNHKECARVFTAIVKEFDPKTKFNDFHMWMDIKNLKADEVNESRKSKKAINELNVSTYFNASEEAGKRGQRLRQEQFGKYPSEKYTNMLMHAGFFSARAVVEKFSDNMNRIFITFNRNEAVESKIEIIYHTDGYTIFATAKPAIIVEYFMQHKNLAKGMASVIKDFDPQTKFGDWHAWVDVRNYNELK